MTSATTIDSDFLIPLWESRAEREASERKKINQFDGNSIHLMIHSPAFISLCLQKRFLSTMWKLLMRTAASLIIHLIHKWREIREFLRSLMRFLLQARVALMSLKSSCSEEI